MPTSPRVLILAAFYGIDTPLEDLEAFRSKQK